MSRLFSRLLIIVALAAASGCVSQPESVALAEPADVAAEAPLGSRIKKRSAIAPTSGVSREDIEQSRVQANAIRTGIVNDGGR
jgi:hypothetical protein